MVKLINFQNSVILSKFDKKLSKVHQVIYSLAPISIPNMKALAQILKYFLRYLAHKIFKIFFQREIIQKGGITQKRKKIWFIFFFMRNPYMKFQDTSIHRLKVKKKVQTHGHMDKPKAICPTNFFKVGGIIISL